MTTNLSSTENLTKFPESVPSSPDRGQQRILTKLDVHPIRETLYNELHNRPFHLLNSPAQLTHIAIQHEGKLREEEHLFLSALCDSYQIYAPARTMPCYHQDFGLFSLRWERHLEFSTYTFIHESPLSSQPFEKNAIDYVPAQWLEQLPGKVVVALHLVVERCHNQEEPDVMVVRDFFDNLRMVGSQPAEGGAKVWTTFRLHEDGFGRFLVYDRGLTDSQLGRLVQRLLELETYRLMATLGLPTAQEINADLNGLEHQLKELTAQIAALEEGVSDRDLLAEVSSMAAKVEAFRSQSNYRFAATTAYYNVVLQRMEVLKEKEVTGHLTLNEFLTRRLTPAVRTCQTVSSRLEDISRRVTRASELLRTRVEMVVQEQNQQLLSSMNKRANVQLRMQQTVEGLSVAAISYYSIGLVKYTVDSLKGLGVKFDKDLVMGAAVPLVIFTVFMGTRYIHKRLFKDVDH